MPGAKAELEPAESTLPVKSRPGIRVGRSFGSGQASSPRVREVHFVRKRSVVGVPSAGLGCGDRWSFWVVGSKRRVGVVDGMVGFAIAIAYGGDLSMIYDRRVVLTM